MPGDEKPALIGGVDAQTAAKLLITITFLPLIAYLVIHGSKTGEGSMIGVALAMISALGLFWGTPRKGDGGSG